MSLTYSSYVTTLAGMLVVQSADADYLQVLPSIIDYAEGRIYRDLDLLAAEVTDTGSLSANTRDWTLPVPSQGTYDIINNVNIVESGIRTPLKPVSKAVVDTLWGITNAASSSTRPAIFAMKSNTAVTFGPPSGATITIEVTGRVRPTPLSASNTSTYLTTQYPELFLIASMIFGSGWQKNYGAGSDDSGQAMSWESQYEKLLSAADQTSAREDFAGASWTSRRVEPTAQPQRG